MEHLPLLVVLILSGHYALVLGNHHISVVDMEYVNQQEWTLMRSLRTYINNMEINLQKLGDIIKRAGNRRQLEHDLHKSKVSHNTTSPTTALRIVKGFIGTWDRAGILIKDTVKLKKSYRRFMKAKQRLLPTVNDMQHAVVDVFRIQTKNKLHVEAIANGLSLPNSPKSDRMHISDMYYLGKTAYSTKKYRTAKDWFDLILDRLEREGDNSIGSDEKRLQISVLDHLAFIDYKLGYPRRALNHSKRILEIDPSYDRAVANVNFLNSVLNKKIKVSLDIPTSNDSLTVYAEFLNLCDKEAATIIPNRTSPQLTCGFKQDHPRLILKPSRYEVLSINPRLVLFYNVINNVDISAMKTIAIPKLGRPMVSRWIDNHYTGQQRANSWAWLNSKSLAIQRLNSRVEALTGLSTEEASSLQVTRYGLGNYHLPHFDWLKKYSSSVISGFMRGNRLATALVYLNEPETGGETVFLAPAIKLKPVKGAALFWYNLHKNGRPDLSTKFGSCAVISGTKWVASRWFYSYGQEFLYPCSLDVNS